MKPLKSTLAIFTGTWILFSCANSSEFNQSNLVGTWDINKVEVRDLNTDTANNNINFAPGTAYFIFESNGNNYSVTPYGNDTATYQVSTFDGKDIIIISYQGEPDTDTVEVINFTGSLLDLSTKIDEINDVSNS